MQGGEMRTSGESCAREESDLSLNLSSTKKKTPALCRGLLGDTGIEPVTSTMSR